MGYVLANVQEDLEHGGIVKQPVDGRTQQPSSQALSSEVFPNADKLYLTSLRTLVDASRGKSENVCSLCGDKHPVARTYHVQDSPSTVVGIRKQGVVQLQERRFVALLKRAAGCLLARNPVSGC